MRPIKLYLYNLSSLVIRLATNTVLIQGCIIVHALSIHFFAVEGINEDFIVLDTTHLLVGQNPSPLSVPVTVRLDGIALEPAEEFILSLEPTNPAARQILAEGITLPEISVVIRDLDGKKYL